MKIAKNVVLWCIVVLIGVPCMAMAHAIDAAVFRKTKISKYVKAIFKRVAEAID